MPTSNRESASIPAPAESAGRAELLQRMLDKSPFAVIAHAAVRTDSGEIIDFEITAFNQKSYEIVGYDASGFTVGKRLFDLYPIQAVYLDRFRQLVTEQGAFSEEHFYPRTNRWLRIHFAAIPDGFVATFEDITEVKAQHQQLQEKTRYAEEQSRFLRSVIDNSPCGIVLFEAIRDAKGQIEDFRYLLTNPVNAAVVQKSVDELEGHRWLPLFPSFRGTVMEQTLHEVTQTGEPRRLLTPVESDGIHGWFDIQFVKQGDGVLMLFLDVTEAQRIKQETDALNEDLRRSNENLQQFAYIASHDLQEPLRKIQSFGDVLQGQFGTQLGATGTDLIGRMQSAARRMQALVQDLLAFSRLSTDLSAFAAVDLSQLLVAVQADLEVAILKEEAQITVGDLPVVLGDFNQLRQLFQNLLSNAIKFHHPGKTPRIRVSSRLVAGQQLPPEAPLSRAGTYICLEVQDNGIGFDEQYREQIFVMFQRLHGKQQYAGTGIGLAICKKVVENHDGYLTARSQLGDGATFSVFLPAVE